MYFECEEEIQLNYYSFYACGYSVIPLQYVEKTVLSLLNCIGTFVQNKLSLCLSLSHHHPVLITLYVCLESF